MIRYIIYINRFREHGAWIDMVEVVDKKTEEVVFKTLHKTITTGEIVEQMGLPFDDVDKFAWWHEEARMRTFGVVGV